MLISDQLSDSEWDRMAAQARRLRDEFQNYKGAAKIFRFLMETRPHETFPRIQLGICCNKMGNLEKARLYFQSAIPFFKGALPEAFQKILTDHGVPHA